MLRHVKVKLSEHNRLTSNMRRSLSSLLFFTTIILFFLISSVKPTAVKSAQNISTHIETSNRLVAQNPYPSAASLVATVTSWRDPEPGQRNRSSRNFSINSSQGDSLYWEVYENGVPNPNIKFNVMRDWSAYPDNVIQENLGHQSITDWAGFSGRSLYIANPRGAQDYFQVSVYWNDVEEVGSSSSDLASTSTGIHSFESYNYPGFYIRHQNSLGEITQVSSELDRQDATFRLVPGLAGDCKSFESINYPGHYLRHQNYRIKLSALEDSDLFQQDATFCVRNGLANPEAYSFESYNYPGHYIRHKQYHLYIEQDSGELFNADATYSIGHGLGG